jgi:signal transduction histidine kinase
LAQDTPEGAALKTGRPMVSPDSATETRFKYPPYIIEHGVKAVANVVLFGGGGREPAFGVLEAGSRLPREFTRQDLAILGSYGHLIEAAVIRLRAAAALEAKAHDLTEMNARLRRATNERVRAEEALHQSQKMAAVGQLTGGLSHDFNNILTTISGSLELLGRRAVQGRTAEFDRHIEASMSAVNRAMALTQRLLAFSRRQTLDPRIVDLNQVVRSMKDLICRTVGPFIQIELRLADGLWLTVCDPNQVESALLNLAINARDAMPEGGHLTFETRNIALPCPAGTTGDLLGANVPTSDYADLSVTDTGHGMSPSVLESACDPFFTTKAAGRGTGLGLSIIDGFVRQSGGEVQLQSEVGQGTTVKIYLPRFRKVNKGETVSDGDISAARSNLIATDASWQ